MMGIEEEVLNEIEDSKEATVEDTQEDAGTVECPNCEGSGVKRLLNRTCNRCQGTGVVAPRI